MTDASRTCGDGVDRRGGGMLAAALDWAGRRRSARERRRVLAELARFSDRILADLGVSRHELEAEVDAVGGRPAPAPKPCGG